MSDSNKLLNWAILFFLWVVIYLGTIATPAFFDDADSIHAEAAREMVLGNDWVTLHINNGVRYLEKAPLMYWLSALAIKGFGPSEGAVRLPMALFAGLLTVLLYCFGRRFWGERAGFYAALVYVTSLGPFAFTRILLPDVMLTYFLTLAFYGYLQVVAKPEAAWLLAGRWDPRVLAIYACAALAVLTKGLVGCVFVGGLIFLHLLLTGRWELLRRAHIGMGLVVFFVIGAPWHLLGGLRNQGFLWFYFVNEHVLRYLGLRYPKDYDTVPLALFWILHLAWVFPWSIFLWGLRRSLPRWWREQDTDGQVRLFIYVWVLFIIVFFSFSTSQEYYTFPALPGFALLLGQVLTRLETREGERDHNKAVASLAVLAVLGVVAATFLLGLAWMGKSGVASNDLTGTLTWNPGNYALSFGHFQDLTPSTFGRLFWLVLVTALLFFFGPLLAWATARLAAIRRDWRLPSILLALMMAGLLHCYHAGMIAFEPVLSSKSLAEAILREYHPGDQIVINGRYEVGSSINYYTQKPVNILNGRIGNLWFGSFFPDSHVTFYLDATFLTVWESGQRVFFYSEGPVLQAFLKRHPEFTYRVLAEGGGQEDPGKLAMMSPEDNFARLKEESSRKTMSTQSVSATRFTEVGQRFVRLVRHPLFWLALAALPLLSVHLGKPALNDSEAMYAEIPREMRASGDWITPHLNGTRHFDKPPLLYWLVAIAQDTIGETEVAARLWSVLATWATIFVVGAIGRLLYGDRAGWLGALVFATSLGPYIFGGQAIIDPLMTFLIALAILSYLKGYVDRDKDGSFWPWLMYGSLGLATLAKGILGLGLPSAIIGLHVLLTGRLPRFISWRLLAGLGIVAVIAVPWHLAAAVSNPDFLGYFLLHEHWQRFTGQRFPRHEFLSLPVFLTLTLVWTFPWVAVVPQALRRAVHRFTQGGLRHSEDLLPLLWLTIIIGLFSASRSRLEYYALPAIPAFALLLGKLWDEMLKGAADRPSSRTGLIALSVMSVIMTGVAVAAYGILGPGKDLVFKAIASSWPTAGWVSGPEQIAALARIRVPALAAMAGAAVFTTGALVAVLRSRPGFACGLLAMMMAPFFLCVHWGFLVMEPFMSTRPIAAIVQRAAGPEDLVVAQEPPEYMWIGGITYYAKRMVHVLKNPEYDRIPAQRREPADRFLDREGLAAVWNSGRRVVMVVDAALAADLQTALSGIGPVRVVGQSANVVVLDNSREG